MEVIDEASAVDRNWYAKYTKFYQASVTLYLLYEDTDHPYLPRVKLATESPPAQVWAKTTTPLPSRHNDGAEGKNTHFWKKY